MDEVRSTQSSQTLGSAESAAPKRTYSPPTLTCYGTVVELTQGTSIKPGDAGNFTAL